MMSPQPSQKAHRIGTVHHLVDRRTAAVRVDRQVRHPKYGKSYRRTTKLLVDVAPSFELTPGVVVVIESTRPISKRKSWQVLEVQQSAISNQQSATNRLPTESPEETV